MDSPPKKRGRGRPPGALNVKGSKKRGYVEERGAREQSSQDAPSTAHVLDVDFESEEVLGGEDFLSEEETMSDVEELPPSPPPSPKPVRKKPVRATKPTPPVETVPAPVTAPVTQREAREQSSHPANKPAAKPRKSRAAPKREAYQESPPQITPDDYLGFLRRITDISNARNRSAKIERYDTFFRV